MSSAGRSERFSSERWERVQALFNQAVELDENLRRAFLSAACERDLELFEHVSALLDEDARGESLLDRGVAYVAEQTIGKAFELSGAEDEFGPYRLRQKLGEGGMG